MGERERLVKVKQEIRNQRSEIRDKVILGGRKDPMAVIAKFQPQVICLGYDQNSFEKNLSKLFPKIKVVRCKPFKPEVYKSSKMNQGSGIMNYGRQDQPPNS